MAKLTEEQRNYLNHHRIPLSKVFDASGLAPKEYKPAMERLGKEFAIGVTPCGKAGHTLKTKAGHCIQCKPASIAFQRRWNKDALVYVAGSLKKGLIKVGTTGDISQRIGNLNATGYAGAQDWEIIYWAKVSAAGRVEFDVQKDIGEFAAPTSYLRDGLEVDCYEVFYCHYTEATQAIMANADSIYDEWVNPDAPGKYDFGNQEGGAFARRGNKDGANRAIPIIRAQSTSSKIVSALPKDSCEQLTPNRFESPITNNAFTQSADQVEAFSEKLDKSQSAKVSIIDKPKETSRSSDNCIETNRVGPSAAHIFSAIVAIALGVMCFVIIKMILG